MKYALIGNGGEVVRTSSSPVTDEYPLFWVECSDDVVAGEYRYQNGSFTRIRTTPNTRISKTTIVERLHQAGKLEAARAAIDSDTYLRERWYSPGQAWVYSNDPEAIAFLLFIGADPYEILA